MKRKIKEVWGLIKDYILLIITVVSGGTLVVLYTIGFPPPQPAVLGVIVWILTLFVTSEIFERRTRFTTLENLIEDRFQETIASLDKTNIIVFKHANEFYNYVCPLIESAANSIDVTHFSPLPPPKRWNKSMKKAVEKKGVTFRRVALFCNEEVVEWVENTLVQFKDYAFYVRFFNPTPDYIPLFNFLIIDKAIVTIGGQYREPKIDRWSEEQAAVESAAIVVRDEDIAEVMGQYFETLWDKANEIGEEQMSALFDQIKRDLEKRQNST